MDASSASQESVWICTLLTNFFVQILEPTMIHYDNQSCVQMPVNPVLHNKTKHIEIRYHFIHDLVQKGAVKLQYIPTDDQTSDVLTKPLPRVKFEYFCERIEVEENVSLLEREI